MLSSLGYLHDLWFRVQLGGTALFDVIQLPNCFWKGRLQIVSVFSIITLGPKEENYRFLLQQRGSYRGFLEVEKYRPIWKGSRYKLSPHFFCLSPCRYTLCAAVYLTCGFGGLYIKVMVFLKYTWVLSNSQIIWLDVFWHGNNTKVMILAVYVECILNIKGMPNSHWSC